MEFQYLGTAAAEGWPAVFCNCDHCLRARKAGGRNLRTRSQAIINDDLLIDFPADTYHHALMNGLDLSAVKYCLITHSHMDHFTPIDFFCRADGVYAHKLKEKSMLLVCNQTVFQRYQSLLGNFAEENGKTGIITEIIEPYEPHTYGKYNVTALRANHAYGETALVYLINDGEKTLLYLHDTGLLYDDAVAYLVENNIKADLVSYDCTFVSLPSGGGHLGLDSCVTTRDMLRNKGIVNENTVNVINHFSHNGGLIHDELVPVAEGLGFLTAYDGMKITL